MKLKEEVVKHFAYLFEQRGFTLVSGDEFVLIAESAELRLRFIRDRADFFLDLATRADPDRWVGLYETLSKLANEHAVTHHLKPVNRPAQVSSALRTHFEELRDFMTSA